MHWAVQPSNQQATIDELCFPFLVDGSQGKKNTIHEGNTTAHQASIHPSPQCVPV
jgi:hypothetical protein